MKKEFDIAEEWVPYELHPETPAAGVLLKSVFPGLDEEKMLAGINKAGALYGVAFERIEVMANSRLALEASEFARDSGKFEEAHARLFRAYFQQGRNISEKNIILELCKELGLDQGKLGDALEKRIYSLRLEQTRERGKKYGVNGLPTFIVNGKGKIVGAQPYSVFQKALKIFV